MLSRGEDAVEWMVLVNGEGCTEGLTESGAVAVGSDDGTDQWTG